MDSRLQPVLALTQRWAPSIVLSLLFGIGVLSCPSCLGAGDWDFFTAQATAAHHAVFDYGQLPLWNPYHCGGASLIDSFQARVFAPSFGFTMLFGPFLGNRIWWIVILALGIEGSRRFAASVGAGRWGTWLCALTVCCNGSVALHVAAGHLGLVTVVLLPWVLLGMNQSLTHGNRGWVSAALWSAVILLEGGLQVFVLGSLLVGSWVVYESVRSRQARPLQVAAGTVLLAVGLSAILLLPAGLLLAGLNRGALPAEAIPPSALFDIFLAPNQNSGGRTRFAGQIWWWHEYGTYLGPVLLAALAAGAGIAKRQALPWLVLGFLFLWTGLGDTGLVNPWTALHQLPVFSKIRVCSRMFLYMTICWGIAASLGFDKLGRWALPTLVLIAGNLLWLQFPILSGAFTQQDGALGAASDVLRQPFTQRAYLGHRESMSREHRASSTLDVLANRGDLHCYDPAAPRLFARQLWPQAGEVAVAVPDGAPAAKARIVQWTPSSVTIEAVGLASPGLLVWNMNYHPSWQSHDGRPLVTPMGLIGMNVTPDAPRLTFEFRPVALVFGALISLLSLLIAMRLLRPATVPKD